MDRLLPWLRQTGAGYIAIALVLAALAWRVSSGGDASGPTDESAATVPIEISQEREDRPVVIHVAGAVRKPGVYKVPRGSRIQAALMKAGGPLRRANLAGVNLAAPLQDGQQVVVPERIVAGAPGDGASVDVSGPISLSSATQEELEALDGVGPTLAARILEWRQQNGGFASVDQLLEVSGIGEGRLATMREKVTP